MSEVLISKLISRTRGPRILFLIDEVTSITAGGTERQLLQLVQIAIKTGLSPQICVLRGSNWLTPELAGCPVTQLHWRTLGSPASLLTLMRTVRWMRSQRFAALQTFFSESNLIGPWMGRMAGIPVVLGTRRNLNVEAAALGRMPLVTQWASNLLVNGILANSEAVLRRTVATERAPLRKMLVAYNGIDVPAITPAPHHRAQMRATLGLSEQDILVGNISGLRAVKGVDLFIEAASIASKVESRLRFVLVGEGDMHEKLSLLIKEKNLSRTFFLPGPAKDVRPYLAAMDIAVLCSHAEGFSNSLLEYMAAGVATIATDVGGNREALGGNGLLIEPGNPEALAAAIRSLINPGLRRALGHAARQAVSRFDLAVAEERTATIYKHFISSTLAPELPTGNSSSNYRAEPQKHYASSRPTDAA